MGKFVRREPPALSKVFGVACTKRSPEPVNPSRDPARIRHGFPGFPTYTFLAFSRPPNRDVSGVEKYVKCFGEYVARTGGVFTGAVLKTDPSPPPPWIFKYKTCKSLFVTRARHYTPNKTLKYACIYALKNYHIYS